MMIRLASLLLVVLIAASCSTADDAVRFPEDVGITASGTSVSRPQLTIELPTVPGPTAPTNTPYIPTRPATLPPFLVPTTPTETAPGPPAGTGTTVETTTTVATPPPSSTTAAPPPPASSTTTVVTTPTLPPPAGNPVEQAIAIVRAVFDYPLWLADWTVTVLPARSDGLLGSVTTSEKAIRLFPQPSDSPQYIAYVLAHELGHAIDHERLIVLERATWAQARGYAPAPWFAPLGASDDFGAPSGDWAESFAYMLVPCDECWASRLGPPPNLVQRTLIQALIAT